MLENCMELFCREDMRKIVLDGYVPADGDYFVMELCGDEFLEKMHLQIKQDKKTRELNLTPAERIKIAKLDYYCRLLEMNKPVDPKKIILSNSYLSFWIKKDNLTSGKLTQDIIDKYFSILAEPRLKYKRGKNLEMYEKAEEELGCVNQRALQKVESWITDNIFGFAERVIGKDYLKIFFLIPDTDVETEGRRYWIPNLYNKNDFNVKVKDVIYGVPNQNLQMNSNKPFLESKDRIQKVPVLESIEQAMNRKYFFDYLFNCASSGRYHVYFWTEKEKENQYRFCSFHNKEFPSIKQGYGFYIRISKGKNEAEILFMDRITSYQSNLPKPIIVDNVMEVNVDKMKEPLYGNYRTLQEVKQLFDRIFFSGHLWNHFFTQPSDITGVDAKIKENLLMSRNALFSWFYLGNVRMIRTVWKKLTMNILLHSIEEGRIILANHQFNVRLALQAFFEGGNLHMADVMKEVRENIRTKINEKSYQSIEDDKEYYYACGQLIYYFISKNKSKKKPHSFINGFLNVTKDEILKERIMVLFKKYNYDIEASSKRFNHLYSMVMSYQPEEKVMQEYMIAGYISNSLLYEKGEKKDEE